MFLTSIYLTLLMITLKLLYFFYKIITLDYSQLFNTINKSPKKCIICVYGHTSYLDGPISVYVTMKLNMLSLATIQYKWVYPTCLHRCLVATVDSATPKIRKTKVNKHMFVDTNTNAARDHPQTVRGGVGRPATLALSRVMAASLKR